MDLNTAQFIAWTIGVFFAGIAAGVGAVALWVFRAYVQDTFRSDL